MKPTPFTPDKPVFRYSGDGNPHGALYQVVSADAHEIIAWTIDAKMWTWRGSVMAFQTLFHRV